MFVGLVFLFVWLCLVFFSAFFVGEKTSASNSSFIFLLSHSLEVDRPCPVLARNAGKKSSNFKEIWNDIKIH